MIVMVADHDNNDNNCICPNVDNVDDKCIGYSQKARTRTLRYNEW